MGERQRSVSNELKSFLHRVEETRAHRVVADRDG